MVITTFDTSEELEFYVAELTVPCELLLLQIYLKTAASGHTALTTYMYFGAFLTAMTPERPASAILRKRLNRIACDPEVLPDGTRP